MGRPPKSSDRVIAFGPAVPMVPVTHFSRMRLTDEQWREVWRLCGPSVERNLASRRPLALWQIIASAYLEGLQHGSALTLDPAPAREA